MQATTILPRPQSGHQPTTRARRVQAALLEVAPEIDKVWADLTNEEFLVHSLHQYRQLRCRHLLGVATDTELEQLARLEPWIRGAVDQQPIIYPRFKCSLPATLIAASHGMRLTHSVDLVDISATGARVKGLDTVEVEALVRILVPRRVLAEDVLDWSARVVWSAKGHVGIRFTSECQP